MSKLRLKSIARDGAATGQPIVWNGTVWAPGALDSTYSGTAFYRDHFTLSAPTPVLTLTYLPASGSQHVYLNGIEQNEGFDYSLSGSSVSILAAAAALSGDDLEVRYAYNANPPVAIAAFGTVTDSFNRANSATSLDSADSGQGWSALAGTWGIDTNRAYRVGTTLAHGYAVVDSGMSDCTISVTVQGTTNNTGGLVWRASDASNLWFTELGSSGFTTYSLTSGSLTNFGTTTVTFAAGDVMSVVLLGNSMTIKKNGVTARTLSDPFNVTATKHGLRDFAGVVRFDDFSVTA